MDLLRTFDGLVLIFSTVLAALIVPTLSRISGLPRAVLLMIAGAGLGIAFPAATSSEPLVRALGDTALLFAFFSVGTSVETGKLGRFGATDLVLAGTGLAFSLALGLAIGRLVFGFGILESLLLGAVFSAQSPLPRSLAAGKSLGNPRRAAGVLAANDVAELLRAATMAIFFALLAAGPGQQWLYLVKTAGLALAALISLPALAAFALRRFEPDGTWDFLLLLCLALLTSLGSLLVGLPAPLGALLAGLALGRFAPDASTLERRLGFAGSALFFPLLFVPAGLGLGRLLSTAAPAGPASMTGAITAALIIAIALFSRAAASASAAPFFPLSRLFLLLGIGIIPGTWPSTLVYAILLSSLGIFGAKGGAVLSGTIAAIAVMGIADRFFVSGRATVPTRSGEENSRRRLAIPSVARKGGGPVIVALSNPATAPGLLSLAFHMGQRGSAAIVRPLVVVPESDEDEREMERAENLLAQAMVAARDEVVTLEPVSLRSSSVAEGIQRSADKLEDATILLGWNRAPRLSSAFSGGIIESLLRRTDNLVIVARTGKGLASIERLALIIPPGVEKSNDVRSALARLFALVSRVGCRLTVMVQRPGVETAKALIAQARPRGTPEIIELDSWKSAAKTADRTSGGSGGRSVTGYAILCGRPGTSGWHPAFESLPREFAATFPEALLLLLYPSESGLPSAEGTTTSSEGGGLFEEALEKGRVMPAMSDTAIADALRSLLASEYARDRRTHSRLAALLTGIAQREAVELEPGVILVHAHVSDVDRPLLFFGAKPSGWRLLSLDEPVRVLVVLCSPEGLGPELHLATLGEIARLFKNRDLAKRLIEASSIDDLRGPVVTGNPDE